MLLYPLSVRLWHLVNGILYLILIATGLSMQYSSPERVIRFDIAVNLHNIMGILLTLNYLLILVINRFTTNGKFYRIDYKTIMRDMTVQARYYLFGIFRGQKAPYPINAGRKFNPLQLVSYVAVLYFFMPLIFISGWALIFPEVILFKKIFGTSGIHFIDLVHITTGFVLSIFMVVHFYLCTIGKPAGTHFRAMMTGYHHSEE